MRSPVVRGVVGGVGARTLAVALGVTAGRPDGQPCDVLVCRGTVHSIHLAERAVSAVPGRPVLAVVVDAEGLPRASRAKLRMLEPHLTGIGRLPWVSRWREIFDPYSEAAQLISRHRTVLPRHLRGYQSAVSSLLDTVRPLLLVPPATGPRQAPKVTPLPSPLLSTPKQEGS